MRRLDKNDMMDCVAKLFQETERAEHLAREYDKRGEVIHAQEAKLQELSAKLAALSVKLDVTVDMLYTLSH